MKKKTSPTHLWLLRFRPKAKEQFDHLNSSEKQSIFRHLRELLTQDDPYRVFSVEMLQEKEFARMRKFRVGNYRIFFIVEVNETVELKHKYKGILYILDIRNRKDAY